MNGLIIRVAVIVIAFLTLQEGYNDFKFNLEMDDPKVYTLEELEQAPRATLPRYLKVKDVQIMAESYVYEYNEETEAINSITYPLFSLNKLAEVMEDSTKKIEVKLFVYDNSVTTAEIDNDLYFKSIGTEISGKYEADAIDAETAQMMASMGYELAPDAIKLTKGALPWGTALCLLAIVGGAIGILGALYSFKWMFNKNPQTA